MTGGITMSTFVRQQHTEEDVRSQFVVIWMFNWFSINATRRETTLLLVISHLCNETIFLLWNVSKNMFTTTIMSRSDKPLFYCMCELCRILKEIYAEMLIAHIWIDTFYVSRRRRGLLLLFGDFLVIRKFMSANRFGYDFMVWKLFFFLQ